jgi:hypothetical protein
MAIHPCNFVDSPSNFLRLYGRLYGSYNLPYNLKNLKDESTKARCKILDLHCAPKSREVAMASGISGLGRVRENRKTESRKTDSGTVCRKTHRGVLPP